MSIWVSGIRSIKDAKRIIKKERLKFPIKVAIAYQCAEVEMEINIVNFEETVEEALRLSPTREIAFLVPDAGF